MSAISSTPPLTPEALPAGWRTDPGRPMPKPRRPGRRAAAGAPLAVVVEDDVDASTVVVSMLQILGFETRQAVDGQQALALLARISPDLVVMDINLPDLSGADVLRILRRLREHADTPVLAVSAVYAEESELTRKMWDSGIIGYLPKPFSLAQLRAAVGELAPEAWRVDTPDPSPVFEQPEPEPPVTQSLPSMPAARLARVRALVKHRGQRFEAIVEDGDVNSAVVRLSSPVRVGDQLQLRIYSDQDAQKRARVRLLARVEEVVNRRKRRYRLAVELAAPPKEWVSLCRVLGRTLDEAETGE